MNDRILKFRMTRYKKIAITIAVLTGGLIFQSAFAELPMVTGHAVVVSGADLTAHILKRYRTETDTDTERKAR